MIKVLATVYLRRFLLQYIYRNYLGNTEASESMSVLIGLSACSSVMRKVLGEQEKEHRTLDRKEENERIWRMRYFGEGRPE